MPLPLELPTIQNWSCHNCGGCCRQHAIEITAEEHQRIAAQGWSSQDGIPQEQPIFAWSSGTPWNKRYRLAHQADGACVFLDERGLCKIHAKFGEEAKPLACRIYPFAFHPSGKRIAVSLRFSCPSVVANQGREVRGQKQELRVLQELVVPEGADRIPPPQIFPGQRLDWTDTLRIVQQLDALLAPADVPVPVKLLRALFVVQLIEQSSFDKIRGPKLGEFLQILSDASVSDIPDDLGSYDEPSSTGRVQFRLLAAQYARKDTFAERHSGWRQRKKLLWAAIGFARGRGLATPLQEGFQPVPFSDLEPAFGPLPADAAEIFSRYFRVKLGGLHFCGPAYYNVPVVEGFRSLALVYPATLWIARWLAASNGRQRLESTDVARALSIADHHHGYSPAFGQRGFRSRVRLLARLGDIAKLIAWYSL